ncbi:MAG: DNA polymerase III subunit delta' [Deltaproteobacteria bacterium]|nr:DNA polymerase III subunit delta' [Deltaproteobacteria bacterium]
MRVDSILGHDRPKTILSAALAGGRLHHAWLFSGPAGVGKELLAMIFARALLCEGGDAGRPCEACESCERSARGVNPDLVIVRPEAERVARNEIDRDALEGSPSREIRIAEVRALERRLRLPSHRGGRTVALISPAEAMNGSAQNALLKTLEEPPNGSVLLLVTDAEGALLPTVRSRCLRLPFGPLPTALLERELRARLECDEAVARSVAALSGGSLGRALQLGTESAERRYQVLDLLEVLTTSRGPDPIEIQRAAAEWSGDRDDTTWLLEITEGYLRDLLAAAAGAGAEALHNHDRVDPILATAARVAPFRIHAALESLEEARAGLARNANLRLTLERTLGRVAEAL